ncbi:MAG TPA: hypothetical protein VJN90_03315 [Candidatus Acidoferrales bacterium]|nr:hypothetical protein [Candidatus Acidoferrales bacterium]
MKEAAKSELEALLVDTEPEDTDRLLRSSLEGRVAFEKASGRLIVRPGLFDLSSPERILILLLARQAMRKLGLEVPAEVDARVLATEAQVDLKGCREQLSRLKAKRRIDKNDGGYFVPTWNTFLIAKELCDGIQ